MGIATSIAKWTSNNFSQLSFIDYVIKIHSSDIQPLRSWLGRVKSNCGGRKISTPSDKQRQLWVDFGISRTTFYI